MKNLVSSTFVLLAVSSLAVGCMAPPSQDTSALRSALDSASVSLRSSVGIVEQSMPGSRAVKATLLTKSAVLSVAVLEAGVQSDVRIDPSTGAILSTMSRGEGDPSCVDPLPVVDAISAAEAEVEGVAVVVAPDDDDACDYEVKVLDSDDVLWEVKIAPDGSVKEAEIADDAAETDG